MLGELPQLRKRLLDWYTKNRRDLPWRVAVDAPTGTLPEPYFVFVSEAMLQQTQVATVIPYFRRFVERLPDFAALAAADEQEVLRLWQGLGYYSRARNLQKAARAVVETFGGQLPSDVERLLTLPGVGRYTAGAVASLAFDRRAPILDGNVVRVVCRWDKIEADPKRPAVRETLWRRAEDVLPRKRVGDFNSALMELGATVCTPRNPKCLFCPVQRHCEAFAAGVQERIPPVSKAKERPVERRRTFCVRSGEAWLIEQRPATGRWAGMWQFVTVSCEEASPDAAWVKEAAGVAVTPPRAVGSVSHGLTHRQYEIDVFACELEGDGGDVSPRRWVTLAGLSDYPMPRPHLKIAEMLGGREPRMSRPRIDTDLHG